MTQRVVPEWLDAAGRWNRQAWCMTPDVDATILLTAVQAKSNAGLLNFVVNDWHRLTPAPVAAPYPSVTDMAVLYFCTADGVTVPFAILAPHASIFLPDGETVDITQVGEIVSACLGNLTDKEGNPVVSFNGGLRQRSGARDQP